MKINFTNNADELSQCLIADVEYWTNEGPLLGRWSLQALFIETPRGTVLKSLVPVSARIVEPLMRCELLRHDFSPFEKRTNRLWLNSRLQRDPSFKAEIEEAIEQAIEQARVLQSTQEGMT